MHHAVLALLCAAQTTIYSETFDTGAAGWTIAPSYAPLWDADATPALAGTTPTHVSAPNSLNVNNGLNYFVYGYQTDPEAGSASSNKAASGPISLAGLPAAVLTFQCMYETETAGAGSNDQRWIEVSKDDFATTAVMERLTSTPGSALAGPCGAMTAWHSHSIPLDPAWGTVKIRFRFDTGDGWYNKHAGWFVDDLLVQAPDAATPPTTVPGSVGQFKMDGTTPVAVGASHNEKRILVKAVAADAEGDACRLAVEFQLVNTAFTNRPSVVSAPVAPGAEAFVAYLPSSTYMGCHWQYRWMDSSGAMGPWNSYGWNAETNIDVYLYPSTVPDPTIPLTPFSENFDGVFSGWTLSSSNPPVAWAADGTPASYYWGPNVAYHSAPNSLNYNDGVDYEPTTTVSNRGRATAPIVDVSGLVRPRLTYWCAFYTELSTASIDSRFLEISNDGFATFVFREYHRYGYGVSPPPMGGCGGPGWWHKHTLDLDPAWGAIQIRFHMETWDAILNKYPGWFIDDVAVTAPYAADQREADGVTSLALGAAPVDGAVVFAATVNVAGNAPWALEVEVKPVGTAFDGLGTMLSALVPGGTEATVASGVLSPGVHRWRMRFIDAGGAPTGWLTYGDNAEIEADFVIAEPPSDPVPAAPPVAAGIGAGGGGGGSGCGLAFAAMTGESALVVGAFAILALAAWAERRFRRYN